METYRANNISNVTLERELIAAISITTLQNELSPYYSDSLLPVRKKAYSLTYRKAKTEPVENQKTAINRLIVGCSDENSNIINRNLEYLKQFPQTAFDSLAKASIKKLLTNPKYESFKDIFLLAGFLNIGHETIYRLSINPDTPQRLKWDLQLALARMGEPKALEIIMATVNQMDINDQVIIYLIPGLIYTRQKEAIDYCIEIIFDNEKNCSSPNAESSSKIICGYRVMELVAPVIENFPFNTDASGTLVTNDYVTALKQVRDWLKANPDYNIKVNQF